MNLKVLIADDMALSRDRTRRYLMEDPDIEIVGECGDGEAVLAAIAQTSPDLLLLDVQMPGLSGLDLVFRIPAEERPAVVFISAFEQFAVNAFAAQAVDYLLKPCDPKRLAEAVSRVRHHLRRRRLEAEARQEGPLYLDRILVKAVGRILFVDVAAINWIEAAGNYLALHCATDTHLIRDTMAQIESQLDPACFLRIHRSAIVNINAIAEIQPTFTGDRKVVLRSGATLTLSRSYREQARKVLGEA